MNKNIVVNIEPQVKSGIYFEGTKLVDNLYLPFYLTVLFSREVTLELALLVSPSVCSFVCNTNSKSQKSSIIKRHPVSSSVQNIDN